MRTEDMGELIEQVRHLTNVEAAADPETAKQKLDALVVTYGRAAVGAALVTVAPAEMAELSATGAAPAALIDDSLPESGGQHADGDGPDVTLRRPDHTPMPEWNPLPWSKSSSSS